MRENQKIIVFGSYVTDLTARSPDFPAPGETIFGSSFRYGPGGKGSNQAVAAHRAGADVFFITRIGKDFFGDYARNFYQNENMDCNGLIWNESDATGAALITVNEQSAQNEIVVVPGACTHFGLDDLRFAAGKLRDAGILVVQLETNLDAVAFMLREAKTCGVMTILNPAPARVLPREMLENTDIIIPNETEAERITGLHLAPDLSNTEELARALHAMGARQVIITLGKHGYCAFDGTDICSVPANNYHTVVDTTGAGDAFVGGFAAGIARGLGFFEAARFANVASSLAVTRHGTAPAMATEDEILQYYGSETKL